MNTRVTKGDDGKYRWIYVLDLKNNPSVLYTVLKVVGISLVAPLLILMIIFASEGNLSSAMKELLPIYLIVGLVVAIISFISYYFVSKYYGGKMTFLYEMDEEGVTLNRSEEDSEKTKNIGTAAFLTGLATKNAGLMGSGAYNANYTSAHSKFSKVLSVKAVPERDLIKVHSPFLFNEVYVGKDDYDFVLEYIRNYTGK